MHVPTDRNGNAVTVGARVRLMSLSGKWFEDLPPDEKGDVLSMVGEVFEIEEIDKHGRPWVTKAWPNENDGKYYSHSVSLDSNEMELVDG